MIHTNNKQRKLKLYIGMKYILVAFLLCSDLLGCDSTTFLRRTADLKQGNKPESEFRFKNVEIQGFGPQVMEGYSSCDDLVSDITVALKVLANSRIESGKKIECTYYDYSFQDDDTMNNYDGSASISKGDSFGASYIEAGGVTSFDTNNQVKGVDEGM